MILISLLLFISLKLDVFDNKNDELVVSLLEEFESDDELIGNANCCGIGFVKYSCKAFVFEKFKSFKAKGALFTY